MHEPKIGAYVAEINYPGDRLSGLVAGTERDIERILDLLRDQLVDSWLARFLMDLEEYNQVAAERVPVDRGQWESEMALKRALEKELEAELSALGPPFPQEGWFEANGRRAARVDLEVRRRKWADGEVPSGYRFRAKFIYARCMLYAFDNFDKMLGALVEELQNEKQDDAIIKKVSSIGDDFKSYHPELTRVRNSSHHMEDRIRDLGPKKGPKKQAIPAVPPGEGTHAGGLLFLGHGATIGRLRVAEALGNDRFHFTMEDGRVGSVDISVNGLRFIRDCFQRLIDAFDWTGRPIHFPS